MIYLYTEDFFFKARVKNFVWRILGKEHRGPTAVVKSLIKGLTELKVNFSLNSPINNSLANVCVLSGADVLNWAIKQKLTGKIKTLFAGPNVVITPFDKNKIIQDKAIDKIILPSAWVINWWNSLVPGLKGKCFVWAAGVDDLGSLNSQSGHVVIYYKSGDKALISKFLALLAKKGLSSKILFYGKFKQQEYLSALRGASLIINIGSSESQGLALQEAWMANVPTLVLNSKTMSYKEFAWQDSKIAAPYMTEISGDFFSSSDDIDQVFEKFLQKLKSFSPREYCLNNFSNKLSASKFLEVINQ